MRRRRRADPGDPWEAIPAELREFDAREWARPGEDPSEAEWARADADRDVRRGSDWYRCKERHTAALLAWFRDHPRRDYDFIDYLNDKRARRGRM